MSTGCSEGIGDILRHAMSNFQSTFIVTLHVAIDEAFWRMNGENIVKS